MIKIKASYEENYELLEVIQGLKQVGKIKKIKYSKEKIKYSKGKGKCYRTAYITIEISSCTPADMLIQ